MIPKKRGFALMLAAFAASANALTWESSVQEVRARGNQEFVMGTFLFRNASGGPVRITSVMPSCDCLSAQPTKWAIAPGESGELRIEFALGGRSGRQEKTVTVIADDAPNAPTTLRLIVDIAEPVAISPKFVFWRVDEAPDEKVVQITLDEPGNTSMGEVRSSEPTFSVRMEAAKEPGWYRVFIRPAATTKPVQVPIRLSATVGGYPKVYVIFAAVK